MDIENLIDELEDTLDVSWHLPLSGGRAVVDSKDVRRILEDIRLKLPKEIVQARKIVDDRMKIIEDARAEVDTMIKVSEEKVKAIISKSEIVKNAQISANSIIADATAKSKEMKSSANEYVDEMMKQLDQIVASSLAEIRKARQMLRSSDFKSE
jgi:cell division septum initiation protein DivIVA